MLNWKKVKKNKAMKNIIKILILLFMHVTLLCCSSSNADLTTISEDTVEPILAAANTLETEQIADVEECDPFGMSILSGKNCYLPLYAMIREEDIYLYGCENGMILYQGGKGTYFDWPGLTPHNVYPKMVYYDFDSDGEKELAVTLYVGSGTACVLMDLHILELEKEDEWYGATYTDYTLLSDDVKEWMNEPITATPGKDKKSFVIEVRGSSYEVELPPGVKFSGVTYGDIIYFKLINNRIKVKIEIGALFDDYPVPNYFGDLEGYITFDGENFIVEFDLFTLQESPW